MEIGASLLLPSFVSYLHSPNTKLSMSSLKPLEYAAGRMPKLVGAPVSCLRLNTSLSYVVSRPSYREVTQSSPRLPPLVSHISDQVPHLALPTVKHEATGDIVYRFFNPVNEQVIGIKKKTSSVLPDTARHFWSSHGLLAFVDSYDGGLYLWAPPFSSFSDLSNDVIKLPSIESLPCVVGVTRNVDGSVEKFRIRGDGSDCFYFADKKPENYYESLVRQLAFSSFPSSASTSSNGGCTVMAIQGGDANLAFCKLGDTQWTDLEAPYPDYISITYCSKDQLFYAISRYGMIEAWDVRDPSSIKRISVDRYMDYPKPEYKGLEAVLRMESYKKYYLLESSGDLLLVVRHCFKDGCIISHSKKDTYQTVRFDVYKFDLASPTNWTHVQHLQNRALFVGQTNPFSLSTKNFPGLMENSVYFADDELSLELYPDEECISSHDMGVFNLEENSLKLFHPFGSIDDIDVPPPVWIAPNMCG